MAEQVASAEEIEVVGTSGGLPVYRMPPSDQELSFFQKYLNPMALFGLSLGSVLKVGVTLAGAKAGIKTSYEKGEAPIETGFDALGGLSDTDVASLDEGGLFETVVKFFAGGVAAFSTILASGAIGSYLGASSVEEKAKEGAEIKPPSMFNMGMIKGAMSGFVLGGGLTYGLTSMVTGSLVGVSIPVIGISAIVPFIGLGLLSAAYGAWSGASSEYERQAADYEKVDAAYKIQQGIYDPAKVRLKDAGTSVAEAAAVTSTLGSTGVDVTPIDAGTVATGVLGDREPASHSTYAGARHPAYERATSGRPSFVEAEMARRNASGKGGEILSEAAGAASLLGG